MTKGPGEGANGADGLGSTIWLPSTALCFEMSASTSSEGTGRKIQQRVRKTKSKRQLRNYTMANIQFALSTSTESPQLGK